MKTLHRQDSNLIQHRTGVESVQRMTCWIGMVSCASRSFACSIPVRVELSSRCDLVDCFFGATCAGQAPRSHESTHGHVQCECMQQNHTFTQMHYKLCETLGWRLEYQHVEACSILAAPHEAGGEAHVPRQSLGLPDFEVR